MEETSRVGEQPLAIITGANNGFGYSLAKILLSKGFEVLMLCRRIDAGNKAIQNLKLPSTSAGKPVIRKIDLADLTSVVAFFDEFKEEYAGRTLRYLVLNAGIVKFVKESTPQGLEEVIGVNHFGGVALFNLLLKDFLIPAKSRVVAVGSLVHNNSSITKENYNNYDLIGIQKERFVATERYSDSKLLNHLWGFQVQKRYFAKYGVSCNSVHPGSGLFTNLGRRDASSAFKCIVTPLLCILTPFLWCCGFFQTWHDGGIAELAACEAAHGGTYFYRHYPSTASAAARDEEVQNWSWDETKRILTDIALKYNLPIAIAGFE